MISIKYLTKKISAALLKYSIAAVLFFAFSDSYAQLESRDLPKRKGVESGPLIIHAAVKTNLAFDTNIFLSDSDEKYDLITTLTPSFGVELPIRDHRLSVEYDVGFNFFGMNPHQNYQDHRVRALAEINLNKYKITLDNVYRHFSSRSGSEDTNRVKQETDKFRAGIESDFEKFNFNAGYSVGVSRFISKENIYQNLTYKDRSRAYQIVDGEVSYKLFPKTAIVLQSELGFNHYFSSMSSDSWYIDVTAGPRGEYFGDKLKIELLNGIRFQGYKNSDFVRSKDFFGYVLSADAEFNFNDDNSIGLKAERTINESTYNDINYYTQNYFGIDYTHFFTKKIQGKVFGFYQLNEYPGQTLEGDKWDKRHDNFFGTGWLLRYDIQKWIALELRYDFVLRKSVFSTFDYLDNVFTITGVIGF